MVEPRQRWSARDPQPTPGIRIDIKYPNIIKITTLQLTTLSEPTSQLGFFIKSETTLDDQVVTYLDSYMATTPGWHRALAVWFTPGHYF